MLNKLIAPRIMVLTIMACAHKRPENGSQALKLCSKTALYSRLDAIAQLGCSLQIIKIAITTIRHRPLNFRHKPIFTKSLQELPHLLYQGQNWYSRTRRRKAHLLQEKYFRPALIQVQKVLTKTENPAKRVRVSSSSLISNQDLKGGNRRISGNQIR